jgi:ankyrin repeat protein
MYSEDFSTHSKHKNWSVRYASGTFRHGIDDTVPHIHELVLMNDEDGLRDWITKNPEDVERRFRDKTPLLMAVKFDSYECFTVPLDHNANIEESNFKHETILVITVRLNRTAMFKDLIAKNANMRIQDRMSRTILEILISRDDVEAIQFIHLQRGTLLLHDLHNMEFPLTLAVSYQARKCISYILSLKPNAQSFLIHRKFSCPISAAIRKNDLQTLTSLVQLEDFGYVINKCIHKSVSYIHLAVERAKPQIVELLLNNNAAVNLRDNNGNTPTHYVKDVPTLKILINHGARLDMVNKSGDTPLQTAEKEKRNCIYHYLRLYSAIIQARPQTFFNERFGGYYRERVRQGMEDGNVPPSHNYSFDTLDLDPLPSLFDELPPLEEAPITSRLEVSTGRQVRATASLPEQRSTTEPTRQTEMARQQSSRPVIKVRHVQSMLGRFSRLQPFLGQRRRESGTQALCEEEKSDENDSEHDHY